MTDAALRSCLGRESYRATAYTRRLDELDRLRPMRGSRLDRTPGERIVRAEPEVIGAGGVASPEHIMEHFRSLNAHFDVSLPTDIVCLEGVLVGGRVLYQVSGSGVAVLFETFREIDRPYVQLNPRALVGDTRSFERLESPIGYVGSAGSGNYGHWVVDDLPRILALVDRAPGCRLLLLPTASADVNRTKAEIVAALFDDPPAIRFVGEDELLLCRELIYVTPCTFHPVVKSRPLLRAVRERLTRRAGGQAFGAKIEVLRVAGERRRLSNQAQIDDRLRGRGFRAFDPLARAGAGQLGALQSAGTVVGVMGAEMANTISAPESCKAVYMAPKGWLEPFYWDLAHVMGHAYGCIFGDTDDLEIVPHFRNFHIDADRLERLLAD